jgi:hypothetical protein
MALNVPRIRGLSIRHNGGRFIFLENLSTIGATRSIPSSPFIPEPFITQLVRS